MVRLIFSYINLILNGNECFASPVGSNYVTKVRLRDKVVVRLFGREHAIPTFNPIEYEVGTHKDGKRILHCR